MKPCALCGSTDMSKPCRKSDDGFHSHAVGGGADCGYDEFNCRCDDEDLDDWDCTHCGGDGICDAGYDDIGGSCPSEAHYCHACKGTGRRRDQVIF